MRDKTDLIYDALVAFRDETRKELAEIKKNAKEHADDMRQHREDMELELKEIEKRLDEVEGPRKALEYLKSWSMWIMSVAGAVAVILKIWE